jgi:beta-mannosidase
MNRFDLSKLKWNVSGYAPLEWECGRSMELGTDPKIDTFPVPAKVPGSVQAALLEAGVIPDWNVGLNSKQLEWVENRHWLYETTLSADWFSPGKKYRLRACGLDSAGTIYLNGKAVYKFSNCHVEHVFEIQEDLSQNDSRLQILFETPPRWLGQSNYSSKIRDWKPRFYYTWDWTSRVVQIGIWDNIYIEEVNASELSALNICADYDCQSRRGSLSCRSNGGFAKDDYVLIEISDKNTTVAAGRYAAAELAGGFELENLKIEPWQPNGSGKPKTYTLKVRLYDSNDNLLDSVEKSIGFKRITWKPCLDAPEKADPWICNINGKDTFLQGVNWTPIRPNFADLTIDDYRKRLELYADSGVNVLRMWGGATIEKGWFYDICDQLGLLVWQEMPISSSGIENYPPDDPEMVSQYLEITRSYLQRLSSHPCLFLWCGGNELTEAVGNTPLTMEHPMFAAANELIKNEYPQYRFVATSPTGPYFCADEKNYGKGVHWDIHGPWNAKGDLDGKWQSYWDNDDSLFRSELGAPGASSVEIIEKYTGDCDTYPAFGNPLWQRTAWWLEVKQFEKEHGRKPDGLAEYVRWSQQRQTKILLKAVGSCKNRFPRCGGVILWMGHDCFPCTANTAVVDFEGRPKNALVELKSIFKR